MTTIFFYLTFVAAAAVLAVLAMGIINLGRRPGPEAVAEPVGADARTNLSQRLMRWRIGLQLLAVVIIMITVYLTRG